MLVSKLITKLKKLKIKKGNIPVLVGMPEAWTGDIKEIIECSNYIILDNEKD